MIFFKIFCFFRHHDFAIEEAKLKNFSKYSDGKIAVTLDVKYKCLCCGLESKNKIMTTN